MSSSPETYFFEFDIKKSIKWPKLKASKDIELRRLPNNIVYRIDIKVYGVPDEAQKIAKKRFEQLRNLIALYLNEVIDAQYSGYYKVTPNGIEQTVVVCDSLAIRDSVNTGTNSILDIERQMNIMDAKYLRQLGHFYRDKISTDPVERYREFFQVLEDEGVAFDQDEIAIRHAVSHPKITNPKHAPIVKRILGESSFNPSSTKHLQIINSQADKLQAKASAMLRKK